LFIVETGNMYQYVVHLYMFLTQLGLQWKDDLEGNTC